MGKKNKYNKKLENWIKANDEKVDWVYNPSYNPPYYSFRWSWTKVAKFTKVGDLIRYKGAIYRITNEDACKIYHDLKDVIFLDFVKRVLPEDFWT